MVDVSKYEFTPITYKTIKLEEYFINSYVNKCLKSETAMSSTYRIRRIIYAKYDKADLNKVMTEQFQHLNAKERKRLLIILRKFKDIFGGTLVTFNTTLVYLKLKYNVKPV